MRQPPKLTQVHRYPVSAGTAMLAAGVTLAWWGKADISPLFESAMIRRGELWRLVTSMLPHADILHLAFNLYWLWVFGTLVEETYGHIKTAALIVFLAFGSGALEFAFSVGGIGLSGVGYGLFGLLWVLSKRDERFREAIDARTIQLFVLWFFFCIFATMTNMMQVGNIAHGAGAVLGILTGFAITMPQRRLQFSAAIAGLALFSLWAATLGRPLLNLSHTAGYEEGKWGFEALQANRNQEAVRWFRDAVRYQPKLSVYWYDIGIAYQRMGNNEAALAAYRRATEQNDAQAQYFMGELYEKGFPGQRQDAAQAVSWYRKAADHGDPEIQNNVAWNFATSSDPGIRNPLAALEYARKAAAAFKDHPEPYVLDTLAEAYFVNGGYEEAVSTEQQALALASAPPRDGDAPTVSAEQKADLQKNLEKYQAALAHTKTVTVSYDKK